MKTDYCDKTWAEEHHDIWLEEMEQEGNVGKTFDELEAESKGITKAKKGASQVLSNNRSL